VRDAREYVDLAEKAHGAFQRPVTFDYIWGETLQELDRADVDLRIINLETAITSAETRWPGKEIHYRMHPLNIGCLSAARINGCALANNHILDWGYEGLSETLQSLDSAGIAHAGAGKDADEAAMPAVLDLAENGRVLLFAFGSTTSGIPHEWRATSISPGVNLLDDLSEATTARVASQMRQHQQPGDVLVASIHWGSNWGYDIPPEQIAFAHRLVDEGVAIVHGHSSHHVKAIEVFRGRLILYGCLDLRNSQLVSASLVPMQMRRFRLERASAADAEWLCALLNRLGAPLETHVELTADKKLTLKWRLSNVRAPVTCRREPI
jgi:poly-gamma-glutamate synthesis protein (capsule biosynthesis protein)